MTENLAALKLFVRVARLGSFSRAGRELGLSQPTASRIIASLEKELGAGLFVRTTRLVTLTGAGSDYLSRIEPILDALEEANHAASGSTLLKGVLRVGLSSSLAVREIIPRLPRFVDRHPDLKVELLVNDQRQDLVLEGVDVAIRLGPLADSSAVARKITKIRRMVAASPGYLERAGVPHVPADLASHRLIAGPLGSPALTFRNGGRQETIKMDGGLSISLNEAAISAAVAGLGIFPTGAIKTLPEIVSGSLVQILPDWELDPIDVHAVYIGGRNAKPAARVFTDFLISEFQSGVAEPLNDGRLVLVPRR